MNELAAAVSDQPPGGVQAPQGARARRADRRAAAGAVASVPSARRTAEGRVRLARLVPPLLEPRASTAWTRDCKQATIPTMAEPSRRAAARASTASRSPACSTLRASGSGRNGLTPRPSRTGSEAPEAEVPLSTVAMDVTPGRWVEGDDVRRVRPPGDPLARRVPRGRRARAARVHGHRPAPRQVTSSSPSPSPISATAVPRC